MRGSRIDDLEAFVAIVDKGGQTAAARHLRRSLQSIGRSPAALEREVGVELVRRTTRRSGPTDAGQEFYLSVRPALAEIKEAKVEAANRSGQPSGLLRVGAPVAFAAAFAVPAIAALMTRYPHVEGELRASDGPVDLFEHDLDLAVRIRELPDSSLQAGRTRVHAHGRDHRSLRAAGLPADMIPHSASLNQREQAASTSRPARTIRAHSHLS